MYAVLGDKPVTVIGLDAPVNSVALPLRITLYPVMADPPFAGTENEMVALYTDIEALGLTGGCGAVGTGVIALLALLSGPETLVAFVPFTLNVYAVLTVNPVTIIGDVAEEPVIEPGVEVAV